MCFPQVKVICRVLHKLIYKVTLCESPPKRLQDTVLLYIVLFLNYFFFLCIWCSFTDSLAGLFVRSCPNKLQGGNSFYACLISAIFPCTALSVPLQMMASTDGTQWLKEPDSIRQPDLASNIHPAEMVRKI